MEEASAETQKTIEAFASSACVGLFDAYGVKLQALPPETPLQSPILLTGVIGFTGPGLRGTCILASSEGPLKESNPTPGSFRDWIAELANQLIGRVKNQLLRGGAEVYVTTPVVMRGEHLAPLPRFVLMPQAFSTEEGGRVFLWVEVEARRDFKLAEPTEDAAPPAAEGETILF